jgi:serine phosphatase RsbU (regulator of sigma subunit)/anti-sigma regulatory factor (Ser/Thr protein kinase)/anti-anti-sigma regulatory factor
MSEQLVGADFADVTTTDPVAFARAVAELPAGVLVFHGEEHVVLGANQAAHAFFGNRPKIVGRPIREGYPEIVGQQLSQLLDGVLKTGEPFTAHEWRIMVDGHPDGDERFVTFWLVPLSAPTGERCGVGCQFVDVTAAVRRRRSMEDDTENLRKRYAAAHDLVLTLQRNLLPAGLPVLPGVRIAAHYLVAAAEQAAGGDWFEAVPVDDQVVAVVGDVVGHGADASAVMGQLRAVLVEFLLDGDDLTTALARLDRFASRMPGARGATVCLAVVDPSDRSVRFACAGHPAPLVVAADGATRYLTAPGGGPLGLAGPRPLVGRATLDPGDVLLLFSDGLVERSGRDQSVGLAELADVASAAMRARAPSLHADDATDRVAELTVERMTRQGYQDDVTLLALRLTGAPVTDLTVDIPARPGQLSPLRGRLQDWLVALGAGEHDIASIEIGVLEAVSNAVEHAYSGATGRVRVEGVLDAHGRACFTVIDRGRWQPPDPDPGRRGRGLLMMRACMDTVEVEATDAGTTVLLDRRLRREPVVDLSRNATRSIPRPREATEMAVTVTHSMPPTIAVSGPLDLSTSDELRRHLWSASRGGALPLTVELGAVTHLGSAGIQVLYDFVEDMAAEGRALCFVVPPGCPAGYAVQLSNLHRVVEVVDEQPSPS